MAKCIVYGRKARWVGLGVILDAAAGARGAFVKRSSGAEEECSPLILAQLVGKWLDVGFLLAFRQVERTCLIHRVVVSATSRNWACPIVERPLM